MPTMIIATYKNGFEWLADAENMAAVRKLCVKASRGRRELVDDIWDGVLERVNRCFETWQEDHSSGASLSWHIKNNLRLYAMKWMVKNYTRVSRLEPIENHAETLCMNNVQNKNLETHETVYVLLSGLPDYLKDIYILRHALDLTFQEIADTCGISKSAARSHYIHASAILLRKLSETGVT
jgi:DNA-directed RNA polymerase specialized sigma24 family protein